MQLRPAFDLQPAPAAEVVANAQVRLNRVLDVSGGGPVQIALTQEGAVLTGEVASEHERAVIAQIAALQPGVDRIVNRLTVASAATAPAEVLPQDASPASAAAPTPSMTAPSTANLEPSPIDLAAPATSSRPRRQILGRRRPLRRRRVRPSESRRHLPLGCHGRSQEACSA